VLDRLRVAAKCTLAPQQRVFAFAFDNSILASTNPPIDKERGMKKVKNPSDYPSYDDVINVPRQPKLWQPFQADGERSNAVVWASNAGVLVALLLLVVLTIGLYAGALWLTNLACDTLIDMLPGSATFADLIGIALKTLETVSVAWFMKVCWSCVPYVVSRLRESADQVF
jgi:hypothetical protein